MEDKATSTPLPTLLWDFFSSVKLSVVTLLLLALTSIIGTILPQNERPEAYINIMGEKLFNVFDTLNLFDMYHSWWYQFLLILLTVNLVICSINRLSITYKIVFIKKPIFNLKQFRKSQGKKEFSTHLPMEGVVETFLKIIESKYAKCLVEKTEQGYAVYSERGRWTRLGVYGVHLSVLLMIVGGLIGSMYGFEAFVTIPVNESRNIVQKKNSHETVKLNFDIRCDDFKVTFYDTGAPREYRSSLTLLDNGVETVKQDIIVNKPLRHNGINIFQSSYGTMPPKEIELLFTDKKTGMTFSKKATVGDTVIIPGGLGEFTLMQYLPSFSFRGHNLHETFVGIIKTADGEPEQVLLPVQFEKFDKMRGGDIIITVGKFDRVFYTGLQVTKDPGVWVVYSGFILIILGCYISFFMSHQKLCVEITPDRDRCNIMIAGRANKNKLGMQRIVDKMAGKLQAVTAQ